MELEQQMKQLNITSRRSQQEKFLSLISAQKDMFIILPTGTGKSLAYHLAPFTASDSGLPTKVLIVMPLISLMKQKSTKLTNSGFARAVCSSVEDCEHALLSDITHLFMSPETVADHLIKLDLSLFDAISHVFIDESHCVRNWGLSDKRTCAFRSKYAAIGNFRSVCPSPAFVAMTATATREAERQIADILQISDYDIIRESPEKPNIRYSVVKVTHNDTEHNFGWLVHTSDKTIVFFNKLHHIGSAYHFLLRRCSLGSVAMFHAHISESTKEDILQKFSNSDSNLKIVLASSAFSMGMDIPKLYTIVHYGVPADLDQYVQESGRAGRDGKRSRAVIIYHKSALLGPLISQEMKDYVRTEKCRRDILLSTFSEISVHTKDFFCCDNCSKSYTCCNCGEDWVCCHNDQHCFCVHWCDILSPLESIQARPQLLPCRPAIAEEDIPSFRNELLCLRTGAAMSLPDNVSTIYPDLINSLLLNYRHVSDVEDVLELGALSVQDSQVILDLIDKHCPRVA